MDPASPVALQPPDIVTINIEPRIGSAAEAIGLALVLLIVVALRQTFRRK